MHAEKWSVERTDILQVLTTAATCVHNSSLAIQGSGKYVGDVHSRTYTHTHSNQHVVGIGSYLLSHRIYTPIIHYTKQQRIWSIYRSSDCM